VTHRPRSRSGLPSSLRGTTRARRVLGDRPVQGFIEFANLIRLLIQRGKNAGTFRVELSDEAMASAILGATEGMIRDRLMPQRAGKADPFSVAEIRSIFLAFLTGLHQPGDAASSLGTAASE
jgi:hypothetical protein